MRRYYLNSAIVATSTTVLQILIAPLAAFALLRPRFCGETIFIMYLATLMIPFLVTLIPNFLIIRSAGLVQHLRRAGDSGALLGRQRLSHAPVLPRHPAGPGRGGAHGWRRPACVPGGR
ncbi:MAG: hypothetical protein R2854_23345 [Caldilineaceae bacterium]